MIALPTPPAAGEDILPWAQEVQRFLAAVRPLSSGTVSANTAPNGTTFSATPPRPARASREVRAFTATGLSEPDEEGGSPTIKLWVRKGSLNGRVDGSGLTVTGSSGTPPTNVWEFSLSPSSTKYGIAKVTFDEDGETTAADFYLNTTIPTDDAGDPETGEPPAHVYRALFKVEVDGDYIITVTQYTDGAQQAVPVVRDWSCSTITKGILWLP